MLSMKLSMVSMSCFVVENTLDAFNEVVDGVNVLFCCGEYVGCFKEVVEGVNVCVNVLLCCREYVGCFQ